MPKFYTITARKNIFPNFVGTCIPAPSLSSTPMTDQSDKLCSENFK